MKYFTEVIIKTLILCVCFLTVVLQFNMGGYIVQDLPFLLGSTGYFLRLVLSHEIVSTSLIQYINKTDYKKNSESRKLHLTYILGYFYGQCYP